MKTGNEHFRYSLNEQKKGATQAHTHTHRAGNISAPRKYLTNGVFFII